MCTFMILDQPEESISIQHSIGADIIMQLDDVGKILDVKIIYMGLTDLSLKFNRRSAC